MIQEIRQEKRQKKGWKQFLLEEDGMGTVEIILIIVEKTLAENTYVLCGN